MKQEQRRLWVFSLAFLGIAACDWRPAAEDEERTGGNIQTSGRGSTCVVKVTVDDDDGNQEQHLKIGHQLRLVGPLGPADDYEITPIVNTTKPNVPGHEWQLATYKAINVSTTSPATDYQVFVDVLVVGKHPIVNKHFYTMKITEFHPTDLCPNRVEFEATVDIDSVGTADHGGHAGALR